MESRARSRHRFAVVKRRKITDPEILADGEAVLSRRASCAGKYPARMRRGRALAEVDAKNRSRR